MKKQGDIGELKAIEYLKLQDFHIVATNYKYGRVGEIDVIAEKDGITVFVEVKYRKTIFFGTPEESISYSKKKKILLTLENYCLENNKDFSKVEFHIISILGDLNEKYILKHYKKMALAI